MLSLTSSAPPEEALMARLLPGPQSKAAVTLGRPEPPPTKCACWGASTPSRVAQRDVSTL